MDKLISEQEREEYSTFLDALRESGKTNMYGAIPYLKERYPKLRDNETLARQVLCDWMNQFGRDQ